MEILQVVGKDITVGVFALIAFWLFYKMFFEIHQKYLTALRDNTAVLVKTTDTLSDNTDVLSEISETLTNVDNSILKLNDRLSDVENDLENLKNEN